MITAHGGALNTERNSQLYLDTIRDYAVEAIEVDIRRYKKTLYTVHAFPKIPLSKNIPLERVFEFCKQYGKMVNCDVKRRHLVQPVLELAKKCGAAERIYFTGRVKPEDIVYLDAGKVFVNKTFYKKVCPLRLENLEKIHAYLQSFQNPRIAGINIKYEAATDAFLKKAEEIGLALSLYTVDNEQALRRLLSKNVANITTNWADTALAIRGEIQNNGRA